jgi:hypothetical protein
LLNGIVPRLPVTGLIQSGTALNDASQPNKGTIK